MLEDEDLEVGQMLVSPDVKLGSSRKFDFLGTRVIDTMPRADGDRLLRKAGQLRL